MEVAAGPPQKRPIKEGDPGWDDYNEELNEWEAEQSALEDAKGKVLALRELEVLEGMTILKINADDLEFPDYMVMLEEAGEFEFPKNPWLLKALWLDTYVLGQHDEIELNSCS